MKVRPEPKSTIWLNRFAWFTAFATLLLICSGGMVTSKGVGLAALSSSTVASLLGNIHAATRTVAHLTPEQAALDEDFWFEIQQAFTVTRGMINLNNGGVSPSPRIVTEALVRYIWQQEDATA